METRKLRGSFGYHLERYGPDDPRTVAAEQKYWAHRMVEQIAGIPPLTSDLVEKIVDAVRAKLADPEQTSGAA